MFYGQVARSLTRFLANKKLVADITPEVTGNRRQKGKGGADKGTWTMPDLVLVGRSHGTDRHKYDQQIHVVEAEFTHRFSILSVYQAFATARGGDYAWVVCDARDWSGDDALVYACETTGVGVITFTNSNASTSYKLIRSARCISSTPERRESFVRSVLRDEAWVKVLQMPRKRVRATKKAVAPTVPNSVTVAAEASSEELLDSSLGFA